MEQAAISLQAMQLLGASSGRQALGMTGNVPMGSGGFMAVIDNLLSRMAEQDGEQPQQPSPQAQTLLNGLFPATLFQAQTVTLADPQSPAEGDAQELEQQALLQGFAAMLMADPTLAAQLLPENPQTPTAEGAPNQEAAMPTTMSTAMPTATPTTMPLSQVPLQTVPTDSAAAEAMATNAAVTNAVAANATAEAAVAAATPPMAMEAAVQAAPLAQQPAAAMTQPRQSTGQTTRQTAETAPARQAPADMTGNVTELRYTETAAQAQPQAQPQNQDALLARHQVQSAVEQAKRRLPPAQEFNLQELTGTAPPPQQPVAAAPVVAAKSEAVWQENQVLDQLQTGITEHVSKGVSEFTMKLKPEALGEITVKLLKTDGKTTLSITAANSQTAKLINQDLAALREVMRPMQVEVHEAVPETAQSAQQQSFNMTGQQFADQHRAFQQQGAPKHHGSFPTEEEPLPEPPPRQSAADGGINLYI